MIDSLATDLAIDWKDYGPFVQGTGAVIAALASAALAGYFVTRTSKKTPYEHLALLVEARSGWPEGLSSVDTVDDSIRRALAQIRFIEGRNARPEATEDELLAELDVMQEQRREGWLKVGITLVSISWLGVHLWLGSPPRPAMVGVHMVAGLPRGKRNHVLCRARFDSPPTRPGARTGFALLARGTSVAEG
ncbi:hypothetical protein ABZW96_31105 [Nocardia sp. NPDC004168]|uniref:hypothetical protein n=1 Tax=Nocardia sp. NPDC004168 TaxID=3154452 RepID=UPI0033A4F388